MRLVQGWVETPVAAALGWTLLHSLWEGAILATVLAIVMLATRSPRIRYATACVALIALLVASGVTLVWVMPQGGELETRPRLTFPGWNLSAAPDTQAWRHTALDAAVPWLAPIWIAGVWLFYLRHAAGWIAVSRMRRRGVCCASERWQSTLASLCARLRISRPVRMLESCLSEVPMVVGHFRPVILMPAGLLAGMPAAQLEVILLHELAHIRRHDYLVNVLQRSIEDLLFYHPLVWWISRVIRAERENCCDDLVVSISGNAHEYAVALAALEQNRWSGREPAVAAAGGSLVKRIRRLLSPATAGSKWTPWAAAVLLPAIAAVALAAGQQRAEASLYEKWLNEDTVYIIADAEHAAFQKLTTDDEREKFIQQFWMRRDPSPATVQNEFKEEHYRRIGYANQRFRTASGRAGWQTDRGHMYIVYGPPDEIESHPKGSQGVFPHEKWMYWHIDGIGNNLTFTFIDRGGSGDYRLAPGSGR